MSVLNRRPGVASRVSAVAVVCAIAALAAVGCAQGVGEPHVSAQSKQAADAEQEVILDTVVAIVNGDLILQSDVDAERRFAAFQPFSDSKSISDEELLNRLIDRELIVQQMALQPRTPITKDEVDAELSMLRKAIPKCAAYRCETAAGWEKFVGDEGFTTDEFRDRWRQRMEVLRFIEERFRMGILITQPEIDEYYKTRMLPAYVKENAKAPAEATVADRIQEILLQQRVDKLLDDWLTTLRAQGSVTVLKPGEEAQ